MKKHQTSERRYVSKVPAVLAACAGVAALEDAVAFEGVSKYPARVKCALLGWMAMKSAVSEATGTGK